MKEKVLRVRLSGVEMEALRVGACKDGRSVSGYVRSVLFRPMQDVEAIVSVRENPVERRKGVPESQAKKVTFKRSPKCVTYKCELWQTATCDFCRAENWDFC